MPGVPSIYYGSEWAIKGMKENGSDAPIRPSLNLNNMDDNSRLIKHLEKLAYARKVSYPLKYGKYEQVVVRNEQLVYCRYVGDDRVYIALNLLAASSLIKEDLPKEEEKIELDTKVIEESIKEIEKEVAKDEIVKEEPKKYESKKEKVEEEKVSEEETKEAKIRILNDKLEALQHLLDNLKNELEELKK